jgi:hypothetical protein
MMLDHSLLFGFDSLIFLYRYTFEPFGFVAATEGFIFISGLLFGKFYGEKLIHQKEKFFDSIFQRILKVYRYHLLTLASVTLLFLIPTFTHYWTLEWQGKLELWKENPIRAFALGASFLYQTSFFDILPLYIFLIAYATVFFILLNKGWLKNVFSISISIWFFGQFYPQENLGIKINFIIGWLEFAAWQLLFVLGILFGFKNYRFHLMPTKPAPPSFM